MNALIDSKRSYDYPIKVVQFGEGNFLRAFWDKAIDELNKKELFKGQIAVVQPIERGKVDLLTNQNSLYTVVLQSKGSESYTKVESIKKAINPYKEFDAFLELARLESVRYIFSNTTEAGIVFDDEDDLFATPPRSFPVKLLRFLKERFDTLGEKESGLLIFPSELIENNGDKLKEVLFKLARKYNLPSDFIKWLENENHFFNTLVDGIVTGYPHDEIEELEDKLGYKDQMLVKGESYQILVIQGDLSYQNEFPIKEAQLNVVWTNDLAPYRDIKVRILNGFQTHMSHIGYLANVETEREAINHEIIGPYLKDILYKEIVPTLPFPQKDVLDFSETALERLDNPYIRHLLSDINLNSFSKFQSRLQPSLMWWTANEERPIRLLFALAATLAFYSIKGKEGGRYKGFCCNLSYPVFDTPAILETLYNYNIKFGDNALEYCQAVLKDKDLWIKDLNLDNELITLVVELFTSIKEKGMIHTIVSIQNGEFN